jgi:glycosyltransferase involved in cell wall biosynthesis
MITFIIPSLNRLTLTRTIDSLFKQTNPNWKAIIIFDGVDGKNFDDERIKTYKIDKIGSFSSHHGMAGLVRNYGIEKSDSEWIGFLDDDDTIDEKYVETLQKKYFNYDFVIWRMELENGFIIPRLNNEKISFGNVGISFCYKNKFNNLRFKNNRDGEDYDFVCELKTLSENFIITSEIYYKVNH